ncbi:MAG: Biosynthetic peptidoglycan transglycosylase [Chroococcidiopsis cubana SAG 39.79]|uniref:penicillin-binding protein 1C n=1 Tax=Chroococcidiopsis cubana TaxID=171392 RepID=UPI002AC72BF5|nr:penicillin-binding protein 1C [Chroococcidiopsis cubana]MDZ4874170.1 Biosynthetic peptidoglycan transglycosylase [Chroococcidiopsis cubana SAG 39.79]
MILLCLIVRGLPYLAPIHAKDILQDGQAIEFSDRHGLPLGTLLTRDRNHTVAVPLNAVSPQFIQAILAAEDGQFYHHGALDLKAVGRAIVTSIQARRIVSGASTITMQLARMLEPLPRNFWGKVREIWLSWRLAAGMSKDEILQAYVNRLPMGGNIYGVEAAARIYLGMPASELNLAQASLLAAIPNNPVYLNPYDSWERLKRRQKYVLDRMVLDKHITRAEAEKANIEAITLQSRRQGIIAAPHFLFWAASQLPKQHPSQIRTTIDRPLQQFVEVQVQQIVRHLAPHNVHHAAALVIDNHSGAVLAYVGSPDYFADAELGRNDGVQALRQPGSTLKPFLYQLALEQRLIRPNTVLADVPTHYAIPGARLYSPTDYSESFQGPVRVRVALANSLNVPAVRVLERVGVENFLQRLHQLGFEHLNQPPEYYGLGLTLGSGEVSLWELARAYATMARNSMELSGSRGQGDKGATANCQLPTTNYHLTLITGHWSLITDILSDRHARAKSFGVDSVLNLPFPAAVKTGTSSNFRDTWTVGFTTDYTVATWVGNFNGEPMRQVSGVMGAAPLWNRIMLHLHEDREPAAFPALSGLVLRPVCALSGLKPTPACPTVVQEYFYPEDLDEYDRHPDTFYQLVTAHTAGEPQYRLNLPREYDEWLATQGRSPGVSSGLKIVSPINGALFLLYPSNGASDSQQRLEFKLAAKSDKPVEWWLNGEKLATQTSDAFFWELRPGNWTVEVKSDGTSDRVSFQVQLAQNKPTRRGFSIGRVSKN